MKNYKSQGKAVEVTVNNKEENFCLDFVSEFGLWITYTERLKEIDRQIDRQKKVKKMDGR